MTPRSLKFLALLVSALAVSGYAVWGYGSGIQRAVVHPDMIRSFDAHRSLITLHALGAAIALIVGPFQFLPGLRARGDPSCIAGLAICIFRSASVSVASAA